MNQDDEIWKDIPGFEREYQASNYGNVRSLDGYTARYVKKTDDFILQFRRGRVLKKQKERNGYLRVYISGRKRDFVHRLVAMTFIPNPNGLPTVDHIDRDKTNNHVSNLRWATSKQQQEYRVRQCVYYAPGHNGPNKWSFDFRLTGVYRFFLTRELAEKFRDEYFKKIGFKMLPD